MNTPFALEKVLECLPFAPQATLVFTLFTVFYALALLHLSSLVLDSAYDYTLNE